MSPFRWRGGHVVMQEKNLPHSVNSLRCTENKTNINGHEKEEERSIESISRAGKNESESNKFP